MIPAVLAVLARPWLWPTAARQIRVLARRRWWRRWPPLPAPDPEYLRFRMFTQYGDGAHPAEAEDVVTYLEWCRAYRRETR